MFKEMHNVSATVSVTPSYCDSSKMYDRTAQIKHYGRNDTRRGAHWQRTWKRQQWFAKKEFTHAVTVAAFRSHATARFFHSVSTVFALSPISLKVICHIFTSFFPISLKIICHIPPPPSFRRLLFRLLPKLLRPKKRCVGFVRFSQCATFSVVRILRVLMDAAISIWTYAHDFAQDRTVSSLHLGGTQNTTLVSVPLAR